MYTAIRRAAVAVALIATVGCTVHSTETPAVSGPSTFATSFTVNAIPDALSQDGGSQSSIKILVIGPDGKGLSAVPLRVDMSLNGVAQDFGTLSARTIVTNTDGVATVVYTAPPAPPNGLFGTCANLPGTCVEIVATPTGTNFQTSVSQSVTIRLVPTGTILPPAGSPTAAFTVSPTPVQFNVPATFDASSSRAGTGASQITAYNWTFGDATQGTGRTVTHTFTAVQSFSVTLTVTNDRGLSATTTVPVVVGAVTAPTPTFVFSPSAPQVGQTIVFNADQSASAPGHTLTAFNWNFGDGATGSGVTVSHVFAAAGTFTVVLSVIDDTAQKGTTSVSVTVVATGGGTSQPPAANFTFSPASPGINETIFFTAVTSTAGTGHTIASYSWTFGDGTAPGTGVTTTHAYIASGTYSVQLRITDEVGTVTTSGVQAIAAGTSTGPGANFTFSPASPGRNDQVVFDASSSTVPQGQTIVDVAWNFGDGTAVIHCTATGSVTADCPGPGNRISAHIFATAQTFIVNLVETDSAGRIGSKSTSISVALAQPNVAISTSPSAPIPGTTVQFNSNATTYFPGSGPASFAWTFGDGGVSALANPTHSYGAVGTYGVGLSVTDNKGRTGTGSATVTVVAVTPPASPIAAFTFSPPNPGVLAATNNVNFDAGTSQRPSGAAITNYRWNFGDGSAVLNTGVATTSHLYTVAGTYSVSLIVTDTNGLTGSITGSVTVAP
jgi:PKD repeat protein